MSLIRHPMTLKSKHQIPGEAFLHWVWEDIQFDYNSARTDDGSALDILSPGTVNPSDGPDFKRAHIVLDELEIFGSIEIHTDENDWFGHGHHHQPSYDQVILHVVLKKGNRRAVRSDGTVVPTLVLYPLLPANLRKLTDAFNKPSRLPCKNLIHHISEQVVRHQLTRARKEYFDFKIEQFAERYDPDLPPTQAWQHAMVTGIFDGLGILHNRRPMRQLATLLLQNLPAAISKEQMAARTRQLSGLYSLSNTAITWKRKASRPANHPHIRINQAARISTCILNTPAEHYLKNDPVSIWQSWLNFRDAPGSQRAKVLFGTVYLPGLYYLGVLGHSRSLKKCSREQWESLYLPVPASLRKWFDQTEINPEIYRSDPGYIHQIKRYCRPRKCAECLLLKSAISS